MDTYIITDQVVHETKVDFRQRNTMEPIHVVQYDNTLPVIACKLFQGGYSYTLPEGAECEVRWGKKDHTFVYKPVLGCNAARNTVYFDVDQQMSYFYGLHTPILELKINGKTAGSSYIQVMIDKNPIQEGDIESHCEYYDFDKAVEEVEAAVDEVKTYTYSKQQLTYLLKMFLNSDADFVGNTATIESLQVDRGLALNTDNMLMYYWDGEKYVNSFLVYKQSKIEYGTTEFWNNYTGYRPQKGHIIIYSDYSVDETTGVEYPNLKIGDGSTFVQDLPFVLSKLETIIENHIGDTQSHVSAADRAFWDNKLNCGDVVVAETLILNRN